MRRAEARGIRPRGHSDSGSESSGPGPRRVRRRGRRREGKRRRGEAVGSECEALRPTNSADSLPSAARRAQVSVPPGGPARPPARSVTRSLARSPSPKDILETLHGACWASWLLQEVRWARRPLAGPCPRGRRVGESGGSGRRVPRGAGSRTGWMVTTRRVCVKVIGLPGLPVPADFSNSGPFWGLAVRFLGRVGASRGWRGRGAAVGVEGEGRASPQGLREEIRRSFAL